MPGINSEMELGFEEEPVEMMDSPSLYRNVCYILLHTAKVIIEFFREYLTMPKTLFQVQKRIFLCQERIAELRQIVYATHSSEV